MNWKRRSTSGLAIDFPTLNVLGFFCYTISTCSFSYSPTIRAQYTARHPASPEPTVRFNDVAFGVHALVMRASGPVLVIVWGSIVAIVALIILVMSYSGWQRQDPQDWAWIDVVYALEYVKLICTLVKYIPQAWVNYKRKSTQGWSILQILFDITGGVLSLLQLVIDASLQDDWSGITGNPLKLGLSNISIAFDLLFIVQHYLLYPGLVDPSVRTEGSPQQPLLTSDGDDSP
ncbi:hypothetical protein KCU88_g4328, partial [Aureobasidium melanogenum]